MSGAGSFFSCIRTPGEEKDCAQADTRAGASPAPVNMSSAPPPPPQTGGKILELEARLKQAEEKAQGSERRLAEMERLAAGLKAELQAAGNSAAESVAGQAAAKELKARVLALEGRLTAAERAAAHGQRENERPAPMARIEERLGEMETAILAEADRRIAGMDVSVKEASSKAVIAQEASAGNARRLEKLEEKAARLAYIEKRLESAERRAERVCECEGLAESLKVSVEELERGLEAVLRKESSLSAENRQAAAELHSLSRQVGQLSALFNHFRSELSFLVPGRKDVAGG